jgi:hypothetical protein
MWAAPCGLPSSQREKLGEKMWQQHYHCQAPWPGLSQGWKEAFRGKIHISTKEQTNDPVVVG